MRHLDDWVGERRFMDEGEKGHVMKRRGDARSRERSPALPVQANLQTTMELISHQLHHERATLRPSKMRAYSSSSSPP